ncbi:unnamed protein product [Rotaria magnacalcarata]
MRTIFAFIALIVLVRLAVRQDELPVPGICGISTIKPKTSSLGYYENGTAKFYCGSNLITAKHVLTAIHCVVGNDAQYIRIHFALHNFTSNVLKPENGIPAQRYVSHESHNSGRLTNDVAVIRLQVPVAVDNLKVGLVCLINSASSKLKYDDPVIGYPNQPSSSRPVELQQVALQYADATYPDCKSLTHLLNFVKELSKICACGQYQRVCNGGPLVREKSLPDGTEYFEQVGRGVS